MTVTEFRHPDVPLSEDQLLVRKRVLHQIESSPGTFVMDYWDTDLFEDEESCETTRCVAGWALYLAGRRIRPWEDTPGIERRATRVLGLTKAERYSPECGDLFYDDEWSVLLRMRVLAGVSWG